MSNILAINREIIKVLQNNSNIGQEKIEFLKQKLNETNTREVLENDLGFGDESIKRILSILYKKDRVGIENVVANFAIDRFEFLKYFASVYKVEYEELDLASVDFSVATKLPVGRARQLLAIPFKEDEVNTYVACKNPFDIDTQDKINQIFSRKIVKFFVCDPARLDKVFARLDLNEKVAVLVKQIRSELSSSTSSDTDSGENSGIVKLIEMILDTSISNRGSDIHIEASEKNCVVRCRIDGMLNEIFILDKDIYPPLVSRLKMLSNLDIAERRKPQDGRFSAQLLGREFDFRISTLPVIHGESVVMRILDKSKVLIKLNELGMFEDNMAKFVKMSAAPYGMILVTGPTGSGKTTTLYAALNDIKSVEKKLITVEDPVEYQMSLIQQVHVNEKAGLTFASALRSILRQDPDIIMIGEIRDQETLRIAIQAALTGHLVFSTLHTNDAISAVTRIVEMGIEPYLVSGALIGVEAQRLVRKLCPHCKQSTTLTQAQLDKIIHIIPGDFQFYTPVGCDKCSQTGYLGREMVSEILPVSDKIATLISKNATKEEISNVAYAEGFKDFFTDGIRRAAMGITSIAEVYRVAKS